MKKRMLILLVGPLFFIILSGCATVQPISTQSGMPEITICGIGKSELMEKFAASFSMGGANIRSTSNYQIVIGQPVTDPLVRALYRSGYDSNPESRAIFTFADVGGCTYIGVRIQIVTNPGSGFERITDVSKGKDAYDLQQELERVKAAIEGKR